jgi:integrase
VTIQALQRHRDKQQVDRLVDGERYLYDFVFARPSGEPLQGTGVFKYHWRPTLKRLGLPPIRLHDLRHSAATMWLEAGLPLVLVQGLLGHSNAVLTSGTYGHVPDSFRRQAVSALDAHLAKARTVTGTKQGQNGGSNL